MLRLFATLPARKVSDCKSEKCLSRCSTHEAVLEMVRKDLIQQPNMDWCPEGSARVANWAFSNLSKGVFCKS